MSLYPVNPAVAKDVQTDASGGVLCDFMYAKRFRTQPDAPSATAIAAATDISGTAETALSGTDVSDPDVPRNVTVISDNNADLGTDFPVVLAGSDYAGVAITETINLNGTTSAAGSKCFKNIGTVTLPANGSGSVSVGVGTLVGLPDMLALQGQLHKLVFDGTSIGTPTINVNSGTLCLNNVAMGTQGTLNGTKYLDALYFDLAG